MLLATLSTQHLAPSLSTTPPPIYYTLPVAAGTLLACSHRLSSFPTVSITPYNIPNLAALGTTNDLAPKVVSQSQPPLPSFCCTPQLYPLFPTWKGSWYITISYTGHVRLMLQSHNFLCTSLFFIIWSCWASQTLSSFLRSRGTPESSQQTTSRPATASVSKCCWLWQSSN